MCSEKTFRQAKNMGIPCVLDAAACHFRWVDQQLESKFYSKKFHPSKSLRLRKLNETRLADWIVCPSNLAKRTYTNQFTPQEKVLVNSLGYDPYNFTPGRSQPSNRYRPPTFVYVGQLANHKGLDILLEAFRQTITEYPDVILKVIGPKLSIPVKSSKNINVLGRFTSDQLASELASSDCLVLPSRADSYGLVVLEALAMGVPVIVSENAGVTEVIRNGENGWTITPNSVRALTLRMVACVKNIQQLRSMSNSCRDSVKDLTWDRYQKRSISLYLTLCQDARAQQ
jgi:glycosyltransferase involved in cell wall biosynthesis